MGGENRHKGLNLLHLGQPGAASLPIEIQATDKWTKKLFQLKIFQLFKSVKFVSARKLSFDCSYWELLNSVRNLEELQVLNVENILN